MLELSTESWMAILFFITLCIWCITTFLFGRISVKHIQSEMAKEGIAPPVWDKGIGTIIVTYSLIMVFPKLNPIIIDFEAVRRHTRKKDKKLASLYVASSAIIFIIGITIYYSYISDS